MASLDRLIAQLEHNRGDIHAQAALAAEFLLLGLPADERATARGGLDAAAVLRRFDADLLAGVLQVSKDEAQQTLARLDAMPFVTRHHGRSGEWRSVHEATRLGWRKSLSSAAPEHFRDLCLRASACFIGDSATDSIERVYHLLCGDSEKGADALAELGRKLANVYRPADLYALASALRELEDCGLLKDRAHLWAGVSIAGVMADRGETANLGDIAREASAAAARFDDRPAQLEAAALLVQAFRAQGDLTQAHIASEQFLQISRRLAQQDPSNPEWQRELAIAYSSVGGVLETEGNLAQAQAAFEQRLQISRKLAEQDPSQAGWQRGLAIAYIRVGDVLQAQGNLAQAQAAFEQNLQISRRLAEQDPSNAGWQHGLAVGYNRVGGVLKDQGNLDQAQAAIEQHLQISRRLAEQDPTNTVWQRELANAYSWVGGLLGDKGDLVQAQASFERCLQISRRLAEQDPSNADWQRDLATTYNRVGVVLAEQGNSPQAQAAYEQYLQISRRLAEQDPSNADWQYGLAVAYINAGDIQEAQANLGQAEEAFQQSVNILRELAKQDPTNAIWQRDLAAAESRLRAGRPPDAE